MRGAIGPAAAEGDAGGLQPYRAAARGVEGPRTVSSAVSPACECLCFRSVSISAEPVQPKRGDATH